MCFIYGTPFGKYWFKAKLEVTTDRDRLDVYQAHFPFFLSIDDIPQPHMKVCAATWLSYIAHGMWVEFLYATSWCDP